MAIAANNSAENGTVRPAPAHGRLEVLDGWRALSILLVIAGHWLPLDAVLEGANEAAGAGGMALFFTLSGFLITRFMLDRPEPKPFLIRRVLRILPLAWLAVLILFAMALFEGSERASGDYLLANLLFYDNLPPVRMFAGGEHLWSLAVEMHFYLGVALLVAIGGRKALYALPVLAVAVTIARIMAGEHISIITWHRVDEILAGSIIALIYHKALGGAFPRLLSSINFYVAVALAAVCVFFIYTPLAYLRPYAVATMVGVSLYHVPRWAEVILVSKPARYIAQISYALYVFHGILQHTWLGSGDTVEKYLKRPLLALATWAAAHASTFYYEQRFTDLARRLTPGQRKKPLRSY